MNMTIVRVAEVMTTYTVMAVVMKTIVIAKKVLKVLMTRVLMFMRIVIAMLITGNTTYKVVMDFYITLVEIVFHMWNNRLTAIGMEDLIIS